MFLFMATRNELLLLALRLDQEAVLKEKQKNKLNIQLFHTTFRR